MGNCKIVYNDEVLIDLSQDSVTPETLDEGVTAHDKDGNPIVGTRSSASQEMCTVTIVDGAEMTHHAEFIKIKENLEDGATEAFDTLSIEGSLSVTIPRCSLFGVDVEVSFSHGVYTDAIFDIEGDAVRFGTSALYDITGSFAQTNCVTFIAYGDCTITYKNGAVFG